MTDLIDRLSNEARSLGVKKIAIESFCSALTLYATGDMVAGEVVAGYNLVGDEITQANALRGVIDSKSTLAAKMIYLQKVFAVFYRLEDANDTAFHTSGVVNKSKVKSVLEI